jgi:hypothetical protein
MLRRSGLITKYTAIALTYKNNAARSCWVAEIMVLVFFAFLVLCWLCVFAL